MYPEFQGKTAVVTGGAQGMGREYVRLLSEAGANVVIADVLADVAKATIEEIGRPGQLLFVKTDVSAIDSCKNCAQAAVKQFGGVDYLINNAGLLSASAEMSLINIDPEKYLYYMAVMTHGMLWMTRAVVPSMIERKGGRIVNVSSIGAYMATGIYSLAKLGVHSLTVSLARELAMQNIRVNAIAPGTTDTEGMKPLMSVEQMGQWAMMSGRTTERVAHPAEIAQVGLFLLSDAASYVRGQIIVVDDGQQIRV